MDADSDREPMRGTDHANGLAGPTLGGCRALTGAITLQLADGFEATRASTSRGAADLQFASLRWRALSRVSSRDSTVRGTSTAAQRGAQEAGEE